MRSAVAIISLMLLLAGCAGSGLFEDPNTLHVSYACNPEGATLYQDATNTALGTCPASFPYPITDQDRARGYMLLKGITAKWVSGASTSTAHPMTAYLKEGLQQHVRFERPRDVAGYDIDANYALNLQGNRILATQAQDAANAAALGNLNNALAAANAAYASRPPPATTLPATTHTNWRPRLRRTEGRLVFSCSPLANTTRCRCSSWANSYMSAFTVAIGGIADITRTSPKDR